MIDIVQHHHDAVDFKSFYKSVKSGYAGIDFQDYDLFMMNEGEKHSFIECSNGLESLKNVFERIFNSEEAMSVINRASEVMITIVHSSNSEHPIHVEDIASLNKHIEDFPENCNVVWGIADDSSIGDQKKVILLANIPMENSNPSH